VEEQMNIQKIFDALDEDQDNSALGIICRELEAQGYNVKIAEANRPVTAEGFFGGKHADVEDRIGPLNISLMKKGVLVQNFCIEFIEYHEIIFKKAEKF
jgi:hypothetical protein